MIKNSRFSIFLFCLLLFLAGCITGPKITSMYVDDGVMQYFVFPTTLKGDDSKIKIDITFRHNKKSKGFAIINYTFYYSDLKFSALESSGFIVDKKEYVFSENKILFQEKRNNLIRFSGKIVEENFFDILKSKNINFFIKTKKKLHIYPATNNFRSKLKELSIEIF